ncbi:hypothetical protein [Caulobacter sp. 1776]|uniref:hypothetical protein n=1 Tax=Caulobacter sp. 1776 TaxID=3156420 RepID=UPI00339965CF
MFDLLSPYVVYLLALATCGAAVWKGDRPLRLAAAVLIAAWVLSQLVSQRHQYRLDYPVIIIDTNTALIFVWISMQWRRLWCAVLAALTIVVVVIPFVALADPGIHKYNQYGANNVVSWLQLLVINLATWLTVRARRRGDEGAGRS